MNAIEKRARELLAEALRQRNENRLAGMAEIPQGLDQIATHIALDAIVAALTQPEGATIEKLRSMMDHSFGGPGFVVYGTEQSIAEIERRLAPMLAARLEVNP